MTEKKRREKGDFDPRRAHRANPDEEPDFARGERTTTTDTASIQRQRPLSCLCI